MIPIKFPSPSFKIRQQENHDEIFDPVRKNWLMLTPEEWVRQNFIAYLVQTIEVPLSLISIEKEVVVGDLKRRFDIVVYNRLGKPWMLIECKSMEVDLNEKTLGQMLSYFSIIQCEYACITNGSYTYAWSFSQGDCSPLEQFPEYNILQS